MLLRWIIWSPHSGPPASALASLRPSALRHSAPPALRGAWSRERERPLGDYVWVEGGRCTPRCEEPPGRHADRSAAPKRVPVTFGARDTRALEGGVELACSVWWQAVAEPGAAALPEPFADGFRPGRVRREGLQLGRHAIGERRQLDATRWVRPPTDCVADEGSQTAAAFGYVEELCERLEVLLGVAEQQVVIEDLGCGRGRTRWVRRCYGSLPGSEQRGDRGEGRGTMVGGRRLESSSHSPCGSS